MSNEKVDITDITVQKQELAAAIENKSLGEILKPLVREIHLFDTHIAGTMHLADSAPLEDIEAGDKVTLRRELNKFDDKAILVLDGKGRKLGYIPEKDNLVFSRLMDAGKLLIGKVTAVEKLGSFDKIGIGIFLVDY